MKVAILLTGHVRSWDKCKNSFTKTFLNSSHDVDIFIHTYNNVLGYHPYIENLEKVQNNNITCTPSQIKKIINLNHIKLETEEQNSVYENVDLDSLPIFHDTYAQYRKFHLCNQLRKEYEKDSGFVYDVIIKTRFDIDYSIDLDEIIKNFNYDSNYIYISSGPSLYPCDQIFISKPENIDNFLSEFLKQDQKYNIKHSPHEWVEKCARGKLSRILNLQTNIHRINNYNL